MNIIDGLISTGFIVCCLAAYACTEVSKKWIQAILELKAIKLSSKVSYAIWSTLPILFGMITSFFLQYGEPGDENELWYYSAVIQGIVAGLFSTYVFDFAKNMIDKRKRNNNE